MLLISQRLSYRFATSLSVFFIFFLFRDTMHVMNVTMVFLLRHINCYMCVFAFSGFLNSVMSWVAGWFVSSENSESTDASSQAWLPTFIWYFEFTSQNSAISSSLSQNIVNSVNAVNVEYFAELLLCFYVSRLIVTTVQKKHSRHTQIQSHTVSFGLVLFWTFFFSYACH